MTSVKTVGIESYINKVGARKRSYLKKKHELMQEALHDTSLPDLDRAVYGLLGSEEKLRDYRKLAEKIGSCANRPLIQVKKTCLRDDPDRKGKIEWVSEAKGGIVAGPLEVGFNLNREDPSRMASVALLVPVTPEVSYGYYGSWKHSDKEALYINGGHAKNAKQEDIDQTANLLVASIGPNWHATDELGNKPGIIDHRVGELLVDRKQIYQHPLFNAGIHTLLQTIEQTRSE